MSAGGKKAESQRRLSRKEIALAELGRTAVSRPVAWVIACAFVGAIFSVSIAQHVHEVAAHLAGRRDSPLPGCLGIFISGPRAVASARAKPGPLGGLRGRNAALMREIDRYEDALEADSVVAGALIGPAQAVLTGRLGAGNEQAYVGRDGWLFYRPGVDYLTAPGFLEPAWLARRGEEGDEWTPPPQPDPRKAILQFHGQLAARGIRLIIVPAPAKAAIHPEKFSARCDGSEAPRNPSQGQFKRELAAAGVLVFDPAEALLAAKRRTAQPQFLENDTHWRPEAMELVAEALKAFIDERVKLPPAPPAGYKRDAAEIANLGDIAVMLNLPKGQTIYRPQKVRIHQVLTKRHELWSPSRSADVLVLGDSFANVYSLETMGWGDSAGLIEQLSFVMQRPLDRIARNDDGAFATRLTLSRRLARGHDRLAGKRLVIWQFAARELAFGDWRLLPMTLGKAGDRRVIVPESGGEMVVSGTIAAISAAPKPARVPYRDHILAVHVTDLEGEKGPIPDAEAVVYMWSMREKVLTPAARYRPGRRIKLRLRPWGDLGETFRKINRSELDDEELTLEEPCWGEEVK